MGDFWSSPGSARLIVSRAVEDEFDQWLSELATSAGLRACLGSATGSVPRHCRPGGCTSNH
jgi:hypothetical protein